MLKELVVLSGKGGTGKTSLTGALAHLASRLGMKPVMADADVDAADLHLLLNPDIRKREVFRAGNLAVVDPSKCIGCGQCLAWCRFSAITAVKGTRVFAVEETSCEGCGVCVRFCPAGAIDFPERESGEWYLSETRFGPMVHARLDPGGENSGKLVSLVRREGRERAEREGGSLLITDGPPGIGCPVIASLTGCHLVLAVTEPTVSGERDLIRLFQLVRHFKIPAALCINRWDVNPEITERLEKLAEREGMTPVGRISRDKTFNEAQGLGLTITEYGGPSVAAIKETANKIWQLMG
jgi:MinD superfamily P-loop ATPase